MSCCGRRKPVPSSDEDAILNSSQENDEQTYTYTDDLTNPDTTGATNASSNHERDLVERCRNLYETSFSKWLTQSSATDKGRVSPPGNAKHLPPPLVVTPRSEREEGRSTKPQLWTTVNEQGNQKSSQGRGWMAGMLPWGFVTQRSDAAPTSDSADVAAVQRRTLASPPDSNQQPKSSVSPQPRPQTVPSPAKRRPATAATGEPTQAAGKGVKSKISDKELQEVTNRIGELRRSGDIDNALEAVLYRKVSSRDPHLFMAWTVYQCNLNEEKFLTSLKKLKT